MRKQLYLLSILLWVLGFLSACSTSEDKVDILLNSADGCMEVHPDSALQLLQKIPRPEKLRGRQRADYALLMTQARDKNYLDSLQSDSLIEIAVEYYKEGKDKVKAGKAFFYYGRLIQDNDTLALQYYQRAQTMLEEMQEYKYLGLLQEYIGYLNFKQRMYDTAIDNFKQSILLYNKVGDKSGIIYGYRNIARGYYYKLNNDSALWYTDKGLSLLKDDNHVKSSLLQMLGLVLFREQRYEETIAYLKQAINECKQSSELCGYYVSLGRVYLDIGHIEDAEECFQLCLKASENTFAKASAYNYLYLLKKKDRKYSDALMYKEYSDSLLELVHNENIQEQLISLQKKYNHDKMILENAQIRLEKENQAYLYLCIIMFIIGLCVAVFSLFWKRYKRRHQTDLETIRKNEQIINEYVCRLAQLELVGKNSKKEIGLLNQKILLLGIENKKLRNNVSMDAIYLINQLREGSLLVEKLTVEDWQHIFNYLDLVFGSFISRLNENFQLTKNDLILASLLKLGFSNEQLLYVFDCLVNSVFKMKQRLKHRLNIDKEESLEGFILKF